jgi:predicted ATPase/DNA-binding XRE family transcriptional regulator
MLRSARTTTLAVEHCYFSTKLRRRIGRQALPVWIQKVIQWVQPNAEHAWGLLSDAERRQGPEVKVDTSSSFGRWLRRRRKALDLTQHDLAGLVGCSAITIRKIEADERRPSKAVAARLAECLDLLPEERAAFTSFARSIASGERSMPARAEPPTGAPAPRRPAAPRSLLVGRHYDLVELRALLLQGDLRLLTLVGPPGIGKTRLALQLAEELRERFAAGVCVVALAPLRDVELLPASIAQALGVQETGDQPPIARVIEHLRGRELLLVLDNFEQLVGGAALLLELLAAAPQLKILATSRASLGLRVERVFPVQPLVLPDLRALPPVQALAHYPAVMLFAERAQAIAPGFRLGEANAREVAAIVCRLDGLPLAIELVATQVGRLAPEALLARLDDRKEALSLAAEGQYRDPRHRTLSAAIDWSYEQLAASEQALFRRLGVLVGGADAGLVPSLAAGLAPGSGEPLLRPIAGRPATLIDALLRKSLVQQVQPEDAQPRLLLLETIGEYAREKLHQHGELELVQRWHALAFLELAERAARELSGPEAEGWVGRLEREHGNLRAALSWGLTRREQRLVWRLSAALWPFWYTCCHFVEGRRWLEGALGIDPTRPDDQHEAGLQPLLTSILHGAGILAREQGDYRGAWELEQRSLALAREQGDELAAAQAIYQLALIASDQGENARALALHEECLALQQRVGDRQGIADSLNGLGNLLLGYGETARALELLRGAAALQRELGNRRGFAFTLHSVGLATLSAGDAQEARACFDESLGIFETLGDRLGIADCTVGLAAAAAAAGQFERAVRLWAASESLRVKISAPLAPSERSIVEPFLLEARQRLATTAFHAAWDEGIAAQI